MRMTWCEERRKNGRSSLPVTRKAERKERKSTPGRTHHLRSIMSRIDTGSCSEYHYLLLFVIIVLIKNIIRFACSQKSTSFFIVLHINLLLIFWFTCASIFNQQLSLIEIFFPVINVFQKQQMHMNCDKKMWKWKELRNGSR